jgi:hypothetical protein
MERARAILTKDWFLEHSRRDPLSRFEESIQCIERFGYGCFMMAGNYAFEPFDLSLPWKAQNQKATTKLLEKFRRRKWVCQMFEMKPTNVYLADKQKGFLCARLTEDKELTWFQFPAWTCSEEECQEWDRYRSWRDEMRSYVFCIDWDEVAYRGGTDVLIKEFRNLIKELALIKRGRGAQTGAIHQLQELAALRLHDSGVSSAKKARKLIERLILSEGAEWRPSDAVTTRGLPYYDTEKGWRQAIKEAKAFGDYFLRTNVHEL